MQEPFFASLAEATGKVDAFVEISSNDYKFPGFDAQADSRKLVETLKARGHRVREHETATAPSWSGWRGRTGVILGWLAPAGETDKM